MVLLLWIKSRISTRRGEIIDEPISELHYFEENEVPHVDQKCCIFQRYIFGLGH
jgi:hypothetical protein